MITDCASVRIGELVTGPNHSPIVLVFEFTDQNGRKRFRFEDIWLEKEECFEIIRQPWMDG